MMITVGPIFSEYELERGKQEEYKRQGKFKYTCVDPEADHGECLAILMEEVGEAAQAIALRVRDPEWVMLARRMGTLGEVARGVLNAKRLSTDPNQGLSHQPDRDLRKELVQVGAVVTAWLQGYSDKPF